MEEIITADGKQFKLLTDRLLTIEEKEQVIAYIRKHECNSCGAGIHGLPTPTSGTTAGIGTCSRTQVSINQTVNLSTKPTGGAAPYTVTFYKELGGATPLISTITSVSSVAENTTTSYTYTITDADILATAIGASATTLALSGLNTSWTASIPALATNNIRFLTSVIDDCAVPSGGPGWCVQYCDVAIICTTPTCSFIVS